MTENDLVASCFGSSSHLETQKHARLFLRQNQSSQQAGPSPSLPRQLTLEMSRQVCRAFGTAPHGAPENVRSFSEPPRLYVEDDTAVSCHYQPGRGQAIRLLIGIQGATAVQSCHLFPEFRLASANHPNPGIKPRIPLI